MHCTDILLVVIIKFDTYDQFGGHFISVKRQILLNNNNESEFTDLPSNLLFSFNATNISGTMCFFHQVKALSALNLFSEAIKHLEDIFTGNNLPIMTLNKQLKVTQVTQVFAINKFFSDDFSYASQCNSVKSISQCIKSIRRTERLTLALWLRAHCT